MASVGTIYIARQLVSAAALKLYVLVGAVWALGRLVWVERVFENFAQVGVGNALHFVAEALLHTEVAVQLTVAIVLLMAAWFARDIVHLETPRYQ